MKKNSIYTKALFAAWLLGVSVCAFAAPETLQGKVDRAAAAAALAKNAKAPSYEVDLSLDWSKAVTLGDMMLRSPRYPAQRDTVISTKQKQSQCRGVLVNQGKYVLTLANCLNRKDFQLQQITARLHNGQEIKLPLQNITVSGDVAWLPVNRAGLANFTHLTAAAVPDGKSLQEAYGEPMTSFLKKFYRSHQVVKRRCMGQVYAPVSLRVGDPLIYQNKVVALVKNRISSYGGVFGGVSERAFAVVR